MSEHVVNDIIRTPFYTGTAGETFTVNRAKYGTATDFASLISFSDLGGGDYALVFTPVVRRSQLPGSVDIVGHADAVRGRVER